VTTVKSKHPSVLDDDFKQVFERAYEGLEPTQGNVTKAPLYARIRYRLLTFLRDWIDDRLTP
jgi:hypothetical protein